MWDALSSIIFFFFFNFFFCQDKLSPIYRSYEFSFISLLWQPPTTSQSAWQQGWHKIIRPHIKYLLKLPKNKSWEKCTETKFISQEKTHVTWRIKFPSEEYIYCHNDTFFVTQKIRLSQEFNSCQGESISPPTPQK